MSQSEMTPEQQIAMLEVLREEILSKIENCDSAVSIAFAIELLVWLVNAYDVPPMCVTAIFVHHMHEEHHEHKDFDSFLRRAFKDMKKGEPS